MNDADDRQAASANQEDPSGVALGAMLIEKALALVADKGLDQFSMREVAASIDRSTTVIFQHFGNKDGLLAAMMETAFERDALFHARLLEELSGLEPNIATLTEIVAYYIEVRVTSDDAAIRIWPELLLNGGHERAWAPLLIRWRGMREDFWRALLPKGLAGMLTPLLSDYTLMEGVYAIVLQDRLDYRLLLRETVSLLVGRAFRANNPNPVGNVQAWLADTAPPPPPRSSSHAGTSRLRLLDVAATEIFAHGVKVLNHRRLTAKAGMSTAMISYHFGGMEQFVVEAVWHALLTGLPAYLDDSVVNVAARQTADQWPGVLSQALGSGESRHGTGFYVSYSRIVGQTCLLARQRPDLTPLVRHLRMIEGSGIHHASQASWPPTLSLDRLASTAFAIWIKGWAMTAEATGEDKLTSERLDVVRQWMGQSTASD